MAPGICKTDPSSSKNTEDARPNAEHADLLGKETQKTRGCGRQSSSSSH